MPTYEYECQRCGHTFERFQSITEEKLKRCPQCRGKLKRLLGTGAGILFKGSGFYETDYRSSSYEQAAKKETSATTETKSDDGKSDKKSTATKKDAAAKTPESTTKKAS